jgi:hypothetical protein
MKDWVQIFFYQNYCKMKEMGEIRPESNNLSQMTSKFEIFIFFLNCCHKSIIKIAIGVAGDKVIISANLTVL